MRLLCVGALALSLLTPLYGQEETPQPEGEQGQDAEGEGEGEGEPEKPLSEAAKLLEQAREIYRDADDPESALAIVDMGIDAEPSFMEHQQLLLFRAQLLHTEFVELDRAERLYTRIIRNLAGKTGSKPELKKIKAEAMNYKGILLYTHRDDRKGALQLYISSYENWPNPITADLVSQTALRFTRNTKRFNEAERKRWRGLALRLAREAVEANEQTDETGRDVRRAKFKLQLALCYLTRGETEKADEIYKEIDQESWGDESHYQRGLWWALKGDEAQALHHMKAYLKTRANPQGRNLARKYLRNEPDMEEMIKGEDWQPLITDEKVRRRRGQ